MKENKFKTAKRRKTDWETQEKMVAPTLTFTTRGQKLKRRQTEIDAEPLLVRPNPFLSINGHGSKYMEFLPAPYKYSTVHCIDVHSTLFTL